MYSAKIICDSVSETGKRLTTFEIAFPRIVLAEFNTHRMFSRNSASSRAIPFKTQIERLNKDPFIPEQFPLNCKGMQPQEYITKENNRYQYDSLRDDWLYAKDTAIQLASALYERGNIHKQICNRLLEPFMWHTIIVTATEWDNFFKLRTNEQAQYEIRRIADLMYEAYYYHSRWGSDEVSSELIGGFITRPKGLKQGEWHLPFISQEDADLVHELAQKPSPLGEIIKYGSSINYQLELLKRISVARCARVSYLTHDGKRDIEKDLELFERLRTSGHWSPFEHVATPYFGEGYSIEQMREGLEVIDNGARWNYRSGNFIGWKQYRKEFQDENCTYFRKEKVAK